MRDEKLQFLEDRIVGDDLGIIMMDWEHPLMKRHAEAVCKNGGDILEIGFGMGDSLFTMLQEQPDSDFIGVEVHSPGVGHLLHRVAKAAAGNLRIYKADATDVLQRCLPDDSLDRVQIYFPDPWPKKRHHKRRLIDAHFVDLLAPKLKSAGRLHVATDSSQYADSMRAVIDASDHFTPLSDDEISRPKTKYEQRAERSEHRVFDLCYLKH